MNNRERYFRNFSLYNELNAKKLLETEDYKTILDKLYIESYKLINKKYEQRDIPKIKKLLEIINQIKFRKNLTKMHNFNENLCQGLITRLKNLS